MGPNLRTEVTMPERRSALQAFSRALDRELHNLQVFDLGAMPAFVFQQLYNRLQWEDEPPSPPSSPHNARCGASRGGSLGAHADPVR